MPSDPTGYAYADPADPRIVRLVATEGIGYEGFWRVILPRIEAAGLVVADPDDEAMIRRVIDAIDPICEWPGTTARALLAALAVKP